MTAAKLALNARYRIAPGGCSVKQALDVFVRDARDALRGIRRRPGFTALAVLTLALGIGVNGAALTTAYDVLGRPLPYGSPQRIVVLNLLFPDGGDLGFSPSDVNDWLRRLNGVDAAAAYYTRDVTVRSRTRSTVVKAAFVTDRFFDVFGSKADVGQARLSSDVATVAVAHGRVGDIVGGDVAEAVGAALTVGGTARTVTAVLGTDFAFPNEQVAVWLPSRVGLLEGGYSKIVARLRPGVTEAQFRDEARRVARELKTDGHNAVSVTALGESIVGRMRLLLIAATVGSLLVLAVACANVATLFIGRDIGRRREYATRLALGARRTDLVRSILTETSIFALLAAAVGVLLGGWALSWFTSAAGCGVSAVVASASRWCRRGRHRCRDSGRGAADGRRAGVARRRGHFSAFLKPTSSSRPAVWTVRRLLVVAQLASCCMLLIGAGLLMRTVSVLLREDAGFDPVMRRRENRSLRQGARRPRTRAVCPLAARPDANAPRRAGAPASAATCRRAHRRCRCRLTSRTTARGHRDWSKWARPRPVS